MEMDSDYFDGTSLIHTIRYNRYKMPGLWRIKNNFFIKFFIYDLFLTLLMLRRLRRIVKDNHIDLVQTPNRNFLGLWFSFKKSIPLVVRLHGSMLMNIYFVPGYRTLKNKIYCWFEKLLINRADAITSNSKDLASLVYHEFKPKNKIKIVPNSIDLETFCLGFEKESSQPIILFVGRLEMIKGIITLAKAIPEVLKRFPSAKFIFIGKDMKIKEDKTGKEFIKQFVSTNNVEFINWIPHKDLVNFYQRATICVFPSLYEPFGNTALEAMACGKPVVTTNTGGFPEFIEDGVSGLLVPPGDHSLLTNAICKLLENKDLRDRLGQNARRKLEENFNFNKIARATLSIYEQVIQRTNNTGKINVLFVSQTAKLGGAEICLFKLIRHLDKDRFYPIVVLPFDGVLRDKLISIGVETHILDFWFPINIKNFIRYIKLTKSIINFIKEKQTSIIHINMHHSLKLFFVAAKLTKIPIVVHLRVVSWLKLLDKYLFNRVKKIIAVSNECRKSILRYRRSDILTKINPDRVKVIYDGRDIEQYNFPSDGKEIRREFNISLDIPLAAIIGSIEPRKGQDIFVKAAQEVIKFIPNAKFLIVGENILTKHADYVREIKQMVQKQRLTNHIIFTGFRNDIPKILSAIDILVIASSREGLIGVGIEGMLAGKPVVALNSDGILEVLGDDGILINSREPKDLAVAIISLMKDKVFAKAKGESSRVRAQQLFDIRARTKDIQSIYEEILNARN